jgi:hypothetical protein
MSNNHTFSGGTASAQYMTAIASGWVNHASIGGDVMVIAGVTTVTTASPLYAHAPQLFGPHDVSTWP